MQGSSLHQPGVPNEAVSFAPTSADALENGVARKAHPIGLLRLMLRSVQALNQWLSEAIASSFDMVKPLSERSILCLRLCHSQNANHDRSC
jgi:hypothetical protein